MDDIIDNYHGLHNNIIDYICKYFNDKKMNYKKCTYKDVICAIILTKEFIETINIKGESTDYDKILYLKILSYAEEMKSSYTKIVYGIYYKDIFEYFMNYNTYTTLPTAFDKRLITHTMKIPLLIILFLIENNGISDIICYSDIDTYFYFSNFTLNLLEDSILLNIILLNSPHLPLTSKFLDFLGLNEK